MTDENDLAPELVERLANLDDRLRQGAVSAESLDDELTGVLGPAAQLTDLLGCLKALENRWPRSAAPASPLIVSPLTVDANGTPTANPAHLHPALSLALASGDELPRFGRFIIKRELGRGGFGVVFLAEDTVLHRHVALKVPRPELLLDDATRRRFLQEAKAAAAIDHPHVAPIYEAGEVGALCYLAAAYCPGVTLAAWLAQLSSAPPPLQTARLVELLALALQHVHEQGVLHRDLKPANVLLWPVTEPRAEPRAADELPFVPKMTDFGLAKVIEESLADTRSSVLMGTPLYMSPEQAEGRQNEIGPATDIHALGAILYELLTLQPPFAGANLAEVLDRVRHSEPVPPRKLNKVVPSALETICQRCLEKKPSQRYASARQLAEDLDRFLRGIPIGARPLTAAQRLLRWCQRPERIREAGQIVMGVNLAVIGSTMMAEAMAASGNIPRPEASNPLLALVMPMAIMACTHLPLVFIGRAAMQRKIWAVVASILAGAGLTCIFASFVLGLIPYGSAWWDNIPGFRVIYTLMVMIFLMQTVASTIALIAMRELQRSLLGRHEVPQLPTALPTAIAQELRIPAGR